MRLRKCTAYATAFFESDWIGRYRSAVIWRSTSLTPFTHATCYNVEVLGGSRAAYACSLRPAPPCYAILFPHCWTEHRRPTVRLSGKAAVLLSIFLRILRRQLTV